MTEKVYTYKKSLWSFITCGGCSFLQRLFSIIYPLRIEDLSEKSAEVGSRASRFTVNQRTENPCVGGSIPSLPTPGDLPRSPFLI